MCGPTAHARSRNGVATQAGKLTRHCTRTHGQPLPPTTASAIPRPPPQRHLAQQIHSGEATAPPWLDA